MNFWQQLKRPFYALAPLAGITDSPFRIMCKRFGADVVYSEMVSATALHYRDEKTLALMRFDESERPYVVQLFGADPVHMEEAARFVAREIRPDGIDINFGCPVPKVVKQGAGIALFADLTRAHDVIAAAIAGAGGLPVSIKTRTRYRDIDLLSFLDTMRDLPIAALMVHGRAAAAGFSGPVDTDIIKAAREHFDGVIIANGGVGMQKIPSSGGPVLSEVEGVAGTPDREGRSNVSHDLNSPDQSPGITEPSVRDYAHWLLNATGTDGIGVGQGALGRPWIFAELKNSPPVTRGSEEGVHFGFSKRKGTPPAAPLITGEEFYPWPITLEHARLHVKIKGEGSVVELRKHLCWYATGMPGAAELRRRFVQVNSLADIEYIIYGMHNA